MTDRELLELAAKAAAYSVRCVGDGFYGGSVVFYLDPSQLYWNPLSDDGDALRLAVSLGFCVEVLRKRMEPFTRVGHVEEEHRDNPYAATRRAIVRAAAEIGKAMP